MEDSGTTELQYSSAPKVNLETAISDFRDLSLSEENLESLGKSQGKEHSKGFKRLLMFGRKNVGSSAVEPSFESEKLNTNGSLGDDHAANSAPYEGNPSLTLISKEH